MPSGEFILTPDFDGELNWEVEERMSCLRDAVVTHEGVQAWRKGAGSLIYHPIPQILPKALQGMCRTPAV